MIELSRRDFLKLAAASATEEVLFAFSNKPSQALNDSGEANLVGLSNFTKTEQLGFSDSQIYPGVDRTLVYSPHTQTIINTETGERTDVVFPVDQPQFYIKSSRLFWLTRTGLTPTAVTSPNLDFIAHGVNYHVEYDKGLYYREGAYNIGGIMVSTPGGFFDVKDEYYDPFGRDLSIMQIRIDESGVVYSEGRHNGPVMIYSNGEYEVQGDFIDEGVVARKVQPINCRNYTWCQLREAEWIAGR